MRRPFAPQPLPALLERHRERLPAITSSQLEGASTPRAAAARMIRANRQPRNRSERMILNNYLAMHQIREIRDRPLTPDSVRAIAELDRYIDRKVAQVQRVEQMLRRRTDFNHRQLALLAHAARHPGDEYTTRSHMTSHNVAYATARADLFHLAEVGLLDRQRRGRKQHVFLAPLDVDERIRSVTAAG